MFNILFIAAAENYYYITQRGNSNNVVSASVDNVTLKTRENALNGNDMFVFKYDGRNFKIGDRYLCNIRKDNLLDLCEMPGKETEFMDHQKPNKPTVLKINNKCLTIGESLISTDENILIFEPCQKPIFDNQYFELKSANKAEYIKQLRIYTHPDKITEPQVIYHVGF